MVSCMTGLPVLKVSEVPDCKFSRLYLEKRMGRYVGRQEKTGAEGSGDRFSPVHQKIATAASSPTPTCHPMLSSWIQSRKLTITIKSILLFQFIKKVLPSSLRGCCNIVVPIVDSLRGTGEQAIAASFSSCFFLLPTYL